MEVNSYTVKELTMDEKMALQVEVNKLLATIPGYQLARPERELEYDHIFITDKGYLRRDYLEYGEIYEEFLGETREDAIKSLAHGWIVTCSHQLFAGRFYWSPEKNDSQLDKMKSFWAYCDSYIYKA